MGDPGDLHQFSTFKEGDRFVRLGRRVFLLAVDPGVCEQAARTGAEITYDELMAGESITRRSLMGLPETAHYRLKACRRPMWLGRALLPNGDFLVTPFVSQLRRVAGEIEAHPDQDERERMADFLCSHAEQIDRAELEDAHMRRTVRLVVGQVIPESDPGLGQPLQAVPPLQKDELSSEREAFIEAVWRLASEHKGSALRALDPKVLDRLAFKAALASRAFLRVVTDETIRSCVSDVTSGATLLLNPYAFADIETIEQEEFIVRSLRVAKAYPSGMSAAIHDIARTPLALCFTDEQPEPIEIHDAAALESAHQKKGRVRLFLDATATTGRPVCYKQVEAGIEQSKPLEPREVLMLLAFLAAYAAGEPFMAPQALLEAFGAEDGSRYQAFKTMRQKVDLSSGTSRLFSKSAAKGKGGHGKFGIIRSDGVSFCILSGAEQFYEARRNALPRTGAGVTEHSPLLP